MIVHVISRWVSTYGTLGLCILCHLWLENYRADHCWYHALVVTTTSNSKELLSVTSPSSSTADHLDQWRPQSVLDQKKPSESLKYVKPFSTASRSRNRFCNLKSSVNRPLAAAQLGELGLSSMLPTARRCLRLQHFPLVPLRFRPPKRRRNQSSK